MYGWTLVQSTTLGMVPLVHVPLMSLNHPGARMEMEADNRVIEVRSIGLPAIETLIELELGFVTESLEQSVCLPPLQSRQGSVVQGDEIPPPRAPTGPITRARARVSKTDTPTVISQV